MRFPSYVVAAILLTALAGVPAAGAVTAPPTAAARTSSAAPGRLSAVIAFEKNPAHVFRSRLVWRLWRTHDGTRSLVEQRSWRAGSGFTRDSTDPCRRNDGWLPDGRYRPRLHANYWGSLIKGRAIYLGNKACADGTLRTDLFIHTEQGDRSRQCADRPGDQVCRWEYPKINDYRSYGCVKVSPRAMHELFDAWRAHFDLGYDDRVQVRVRG
ncbi:hypothetical protein [Nocardioides mesophilus]|uniref:L,D-transpeptidase family protein n=1 Tax=Nocardioides mesophilus TaxID=433659 RepID=A0A7G9R7Y9_9ACTN|nr:hypothetical protein [Nocardioides mesophilus]QNN51714.1 hypothetical protein H9L09_14240 [Nocardioides mesophilus]